MDLEAMTLGASPLGDLLPALERLDRRIAQAISAAETVESAPARDPFRGLHIGPDDVTRWLARMPEAPPVTTPTGDNPDAPVPTLAAGSQRLLWLAQTFGLSTFELDIVVIALAPEIDLRYEGVYAYLQDDVTRRRPSADLALNLLCPSAEAKLARRAHFAPEAPLSWHRLMRLVPNPNRPNAPLLAQTLQLDPQIVDVLLGQGGLDRRLAPFCRLVPPAVTIEELPLDAERQAHLATLVQQAVAEQRLLRLYFRGSRGSGRRRTAEALAGLLGTDLLYADLGDVQAAEVGFEEALRLAFREAWLRGSILYLDNLDALQDAGQLALYRILLRLLAEATGITILAGTRPWVPAGDITTGVVQVDFPMPNTGQRRQCWEACLTATGILLPANHLDVLAQRFRLTPGQIEEAVATAAMQAIGRVTSAETSRVPVGDLLAAARAQSGQELAALTQKLEPRYTWDDIVLPDDGLAQLREICARVAGRERVLTDWGFDRRLSQGKGINALFAGPAGTGKTMAAEIVANRLGLSLYKIDLASVVSKYIGETEKNLDRIFRAAENANAVLLFDEADALFGKRSEVRDSHDRYANLEIAYLLQKMEQYEGVAILATNLRQNLDEAFVRRLAFIVHFPFPDEVSRRRIWDGIWPAETPLAADVDLALLANQFKLSGGNIKNIALGAAFLAATDGGAVRMTHLLHATRREYQKMGKALTEAELHGQGVVPLEARRA